MVNFYKYFIQCNNTEATISDAAGRYDTSPVLVGMILLRCW